MNTHHRRPSRRTFLKSAAAALPLILTAPRHRWPGALLRVGFVGVGGKGEENLAEIAAARSVRVAALCDVDAGPLAAAAARHPEAKTFRDFRRMLDALERELDAVVVSTPDHMHGPIALAAMERGKHVYCEKPLAHNLRECRAMAALAARKRLVTQMGIQIHAHAAYRTAVASVESGVIGRVREAHLWVSKSWAGPAAPPSGTDPVPESLDWDLWLGVAPERPYVDGLYHPAQWRGWRPFGTGTLGDMGCHVFDPVFSALGLDAPRTITSRGPAHGPETFAADGDILYEFAGTARTAGPLSLRWTDGSGRSRPAAAKAELPDGVALPEAGSFLVGEAGVMVIPHWATPSVYRKGEMADAPLERRGSRNHYHEWADACRGEGTTSAPFSFAGPLTEAVLGGTLAAAFPGETLRFDAAALRFDHRGAQALVQREYRKGWSVAGL